MLLCCATALSLMLGWSADTPSRQDPAAASPATVASGAGPSVQPGLARNGASAQPDTLSHWLEHGDPASVGGRTIAHTAGTNASKTGSALSAASTKSGKQAADKAVDTAQNQHRRDPYDDSNDQEEPAEDEPPVVYESVTGRVLGENREGLPGIAVGIRSQRIFGGGDGTAPLSPVAIQVVSDDYGYFMAQDLPDGEYALETRAGEPYIEARKVVRAGTGTVDLILKNGEPTSITGYVLDEDNDLPLRGARVTTTGQSVLTGPDGRFELAYAGHSSTTPMLRFDAEDYRTRYVSAAATDPDEPLTVYLIPEDQPVHIQGQLLTTGGKPVVDEVVRLQSPTLGKQYVARSDAGGRFAFAAVESGLDYQLSVTPIGPYREYQDDPFRVGPDLEGRLVSITLEPVPYGELDGYVFDADGQAMGYYRFELVSDDVTGWRRQVQTNANGYFALDQVPAGQVLFQSNTGSEFLASGLALAPGAVETVQINLDWGGYEIYGQVLMATGVPATGSHLQLIWSASQGQLQTQSSRSAVVDAQGYFLFDRLGAGTHTLEISNAGAPEQYIMHQTGYDNPELVIRMM